MGGHFLWVGGNEWGEWRHILAGWGWVGVGRHSLGVIGGGWGWVEVYFEWVGLGGHFLWMGGGGWRYILSGWG